MSYSIYFTGLRLYIFNSITPLTIVRGNKQQVHIGIGKILVFGGSEHGCFFIEIELCQSVLSSFKGYIYRCILLVISFGGQHIYGYSRYGIRIGMGNTFPAVVPET